MRDLATHPKPEELGIQLDPFEPKKIRLDPSMARFRHYFIWYAFGSFCGVFAVIYAPGPIAFLGGFFIVASVIDRYAAYNFISAGPAVVLASEGFTFRRPWGGGVGQFRWEDCGTIGPRKIGRSARTYLAWKIDRGNRWDFSTTARFENETELSNADLMKVMNLYREHRLAKLDPGTEPVATP